MKRLFVCLVISLATAAVEAQPSKMPRIGVLGALDYPTIRTRIDALRQGLKELGYVEGKNIVVEYRWAEGKTDRLPRLAAELEQSRVAVIVSTGPSVTRVAKDAAKNTPIVMAFDSDPVGSGFVASLGRPGGHITGLSTVAPEVSAKQIDVLRQIIPRLSRVAVLGDSKEPGNSRALDEVAHAARLVGVQVHRFDVRTFDGLSPAFQALGKERPDALIVLPSTISFIQRIEFASLAAQARLPAMYAFQEHVEAGGLITYSVNFDELFRRAAIYVDKILKGSKPAELPVEQPFKFDLVINLKAAKQIALDIPMSVLARADRVIQ
jgi:putative tryptophan/tyrosine transport system substrate-binding protein